VVAKSAISARGGNTDARRGRGRPTKFDRDVALKEAMKLFWEHGFEGTSTDDLEAALKTGPSSILNELRQCALQLAARICTVGEDVAQPRKGAAQRFQQSRRTAHQPDGRRPRPAGLLSR
jgi:hypothetical protein